MTKEYINPESLTENLEKLARMIYQDYNAKQLENCPENSLVFSEWESLPDDLKYSNMRQAGRMAEKLSLIGCTIVPKGSECDCVGCFTARETEYLAEAEHEFWVEERLNSGWKYGKEKDIDGRISPYLVPYEQLEEEIKQLDRNTIENIIPLLDSVGLAVCRRREI